MSENNSEMSNEKLIELVRAYLVLYDLADSKYLDSDSKTKIWKQIGAQLNEEGLTCKTRWNSLRDNYRKALKNKEGKSGQAAKKVKAYKYAAEISFLINFFGERSTIGNIGNEPIDNVLEHNITGESSTQPATETVEEFAEECHSGEEISTPPPEPSPSSPPAIANADREEDHQPPMKKKKGSTEQTQTAASQVLRYLVDKKYEQTHPVDAFLNGLSHTIKSLPPPQPNHLKTKMFNLVQHYELQYLAQTYGTACCFPENGSSGSFDTNTIQNKSVSPHTNSALSNTSQPP